jgi:hypothetical protein
MEIAFNTQSLRSLCENENVMTKRLGSIGAQALQVCLADLRAASTIADVTVSYAAEVASASDIEIFLAEGLHVRLRAVDSKVRKPKGKSVDWAGVSRLKIMEIASRG